VLQRNEYAPELQRTASFLAGREIKFGMFTIFETGKESQPEPHHFSFPEPKLHHCLITCQLFSINSICCEHCFWEIGSPGFAAPAHKISAFVFEKIQNFIVQ
jgi:hypothetical protein